MNNLRRKVDLYILSLGLLFLFLVIITFKFPECPFTIYELSSWKALVNKNFIPIGLIGLLSYCFWAYKRFEFDLKGATDIPFQIKEIESINYEHLTFLATYIIPLISFNFDNDRQVMVLGLLLITMGIIYIKTDLFYANPSLALLGFHIYKADGSFKGNNDRKGIILISRDKLHQGDRASYIKLDERIYYVKGTKS